MSVIGNKVRTEQSLGNTIQSHNVLSREDLKILYASPSLSRTTPRGFQTRLIFNITLLTAMRPGALVALTIGQFQKMVMEGEEVWEIRGVIGSISGSSKTTQGGWKSINDKPTEVCVWNQDDLDGELNMYKDIDEYMEIRKNLECNTDRFFLGANLKAVTFSRFFKSSPLGRNTFAKLVKDACESQGVKGTGLKEGMSTHGLRGTAATLLFESGHADSSVALRTGLRDPRSLKSYQNLRSRNGRRQQNEIFKRRGEGNVDVAKKRTRLPGAVAEGKENKTPVEMGEHRVAHVIAVNGQQNGVGHMAAARKPIGAAVGNGLSESRGILSNIGNVAGSTFDINVNYYGSPVQNPKTT